MQIEIGGMESPQVGTTTTQLALHLLVGDMSHDPLSRPRLNGKADPLPYTPRYFAELSPEANGYLAAINTTLGSHISIISFISFLSLGISTRFNVSSIE